MRKLNAVSSILTSVALLTQPLLNAQYADYECCEPPSENFYVNEHWAPDYNWEPILPRCFMPYSGEINISYDYFRSLPEGSFEGNTGAFASVNLGLPVLRYYCYDLGAVQFGASYGAYDWSGRDSTFIGNPKEIQQQAFLTAGYFRRTPGWCGFNFGVVFDAMYNENFSVFALDPTMYQVRAQAGYLFCRCNEFGIWGTLDVNRSHKDFEGLTVTYRAISQVNLFWTHYFENCAVTTLWAGVPYKKSLMFNSGRAGQYIVGGSFKVPLNCRFNIEGHGMYMRAKRLKGRFESRNYAANICFGITYLFGCHRDYIDASEDWVPYQPLANNSNFISDTNINF